MNFRPTVWMVPLKHSTKQASALSRRPEIARMIVVRILVLVLGQVKRWKMLPSDDVVKS